MFNNLPEMGGGDEVVVVQYYSNGPSTVFTYLRERVGSEVDFHFFVVSYSGE